MGIAIALANEPDLLLADELTSELDTATTEQVMDALQAIHDLRGMALLAVTHNHRVAFRAQRVLHIADGLIGEEKKIMIESMLGEREQATLRHQQIGKDLE